MNIEKPPSALFESEGFRSFCERFQAAFSPERAETIRKVLSSVSFYTEGEKEAHGGQNPEGWTVRPKIVLECGLEDGLKFSSLRPVEISSESMRYYRYGSAMKKIQDFRYARIPDSFSVEKDPN